MARGFVYLLKVRPFISLRRPVFKIGETKNLEKHLFDYPPGSLLLFVVEVNDPTNVKMTLINDLKRESYLCHQRHNLGEEWLEANTPDMEAQFCNSVEQSIYPFIYGPDEIVSESLVDDWIFRLNSFEEQESMMSLEQKVMYCGSDYAELVRMFYPMFMDRYKSTGEKRWFHFSEGRWHASRGNDTERKLLNDFCITITMEVRELIAYEEKQLELLDKKVFSTYQLIMPDYLRKEKKMHANRMIDISRKIINMCDQIDFCDRKVLFLLKIYLYDETFIDRLDSKPNLLGFNNGVWDFDTMQFRKSHPSDMISKTVGYKYSEEIDVNAAKEVEEYLRSLFPDVEQRYNVIRVFARQLYGDKNDETFYVHRGLGGIPQCGKKTFFHILKVCLGDYVQYFQSGYLIKTDFGAPQPHLEMLRGVRILYCYDQCQEFRSSTFRIFNKPGRFGYRLLYQKRWDRLVSMYRFHIMTGQSKAPFASYDNDIERMMRYIEYPVDFGLQEGSSSARNGYISCLKANRGFHMEFVRKLLSVFDKEVH